MPFQTHAGKPSDHRNCCRVWPPLSHLLNQGRMDDAIRERLLEILDLEDFTQVIWNSLFGSKFFMTPIPRFIRRDTSKDFGDLRAFAETNGCLPGEVKAR